jgi:hypothetical protein
VGSKPGSAHLTGHAVDFNCFMYGAPLEVARRIASSGLVFDQLIHEFGHWVHLSFADARRGECLTLDAQGARRGLFPVR